MFSVVSREYGKLSDVSVQDFIVKDVIVCRSGSVVNLCTCYNNVITSFFFVSIATHVYQHCHALLALCVLVLQRRPGLQITVCSPDTEEHVYLILSI